MHERAREIEGTTVISPMEAIQMKTARMISCLLATTVLLGGSLLAAPGGARDGQMQAAALLSPEWTPVAADARATAALAPRIDAQARAAALLSRPQTHTSVAVSRLSQVMPADGQAKAAALLSRRAM
ncbi:MAG TPA: hypothetical protein VKB41_06680 [Steroidobacteraceae bacterium]|nr:hypothetical protein [Steroidobacteraceae bacterium]